MSKKTRSPKKAKSDFKVEHNLVNSNISSRWGDSIDISNIRERIPRGIIRINYLSKFVCTQ